MSFKAPKSWEPFLSTSTLLPLSVCRERENWITILALHTHCLNSYLPLNISSTHPFLFKSASECRIDGALSDLGLILHTHSLAPFHPHPLETCAVNSFLLTRCVFCLPLSPMKPPSLSLLSHSVLGVQHPLLFLSVHFLNIVKNCKG